MSPSFSDSQNHTCQCYYIEGIKRKISKDLANGAPAELACKRLSKADSAICELKVHDEHLAGARRARFARKPRLSSICGYNGTHCVSSSVLLFRLQEPRKLDKNINLEKMRVKQLRELMQALTSRLY